MKERKSFFDWAKEHKTELIIAGVTVIGTILVVKNWDTIKDIFKDADVDIPSDIKVVPISEKPVAPVLPSSILENLTGNKLTATKLGNKVMCSAQTINKRLVEKGLATRLPCGEYIMTETGRLLGIDTWKTTAAGHSFSNIEWDEKVLEVLFSQVKLAEIAAKQEHIQKILGGIAA